MTNDIHNRLGSAVSVSEPTFVCNEYNHAINNSLNGHQRKPTDNHADFKQADYANSGNLLRTIKCALFNARSVCNKTNEIHEFIKEHKLQIVIITESWLTSDSIYEATVMAEICPVGFNFSVLHVQD
jgi:hypothetical protein